MFLWCRYLGRLDPGYSQHTALATIGKTQSIRFFTHHTLQMKGCRESNINVWFPFMNSQKWNCAASLFPPSYRMFSLPTPTFICYIYERNIFFQDRSAYFAAAKYVDRSWEFINRSQTHESGNWDWGVAIIRKGIHKWDFHCSVY